MCEPVLRSVHSAGDASVLLRYDEQERLSWVGGSYNGDPDVVDYSPWLEYQYQADGRIENILMGYERWWTVYYADDGSVTGAYYSDSCYGPFRDYDADGRLLQEVMSDMDWGYIYSYEYTLRDDGLIDSVEVAKRSWNEFGIERVSEEWTELITYSYEFYPSGEIMSLTMVNDVVPEDSIKRWFDRVGKPVFEVSLEGGAYRIFIRGRTLLLGDSAASNNESVVQLQERFSPEFPGELIPVQPYALAEAERSPVEFELDQGPLEQFAVSYAVDEALRTDTIQYSLNGAPYVDLTVSYCDSGVTETLSYANTGSVVSKTHFYYDCADAEDPSPAEQAFCDP